MPSLNVPLNENNQTTYLPGTHTQPAHNIFNGPQRQKDELIASSRTVRSNLKIGDAAIFDSRVLHTGGANTSNGIRRILFYFTLTSGNTVALILIISL